MRSDELIALAAAHGVDLQHAAGNASRVDKLAAPRKRTRHEREHGLEVLETATGADTRVYRKRAWTNAELGQAAMGVPRMPWLALCYSLAGDSSGYVELHRGLMLKALKLAERQRWPMMVRKRDGTRGFYTAELASLVLDVDANRDLFVVRCPALYSICMGVEPDMWEKVIIHWYDDLKIEYERWIAIGCGMVGRWLKADVPVEEPVCAA